MKKIILSALLLVATTFTAAAQLRQDTIQNALYKLDKADEVDTVVELVNGNKRFDAMFFTETLRQSYPEEQKDAPIRVFPYMRENLIVQGSDYDRVKDISDGLLKFMNLESRVRLIYFRSDVPVAAFINPNVLAISSEAANVMTDSELEAVMAHEVSHLVIYDNFKRAVDNNDNKQRRALELFCDAGAISIIEAKGGDPENLVKGLEKMLAVVLKLEVGSDDGTLHPTMKQRKRLLKLLSEDNPVAVVQNNN